MKRPFVEQILIAEKGAATPAKLAPEEFQLSTKAKSIMRTVKLESGLNACTSLPLIVPPSKPDNLLRSGLYQLYDWNYLRADRRPSSKSSRGIIRLVDLFCGYGFMSLGALEAAQACGYRLVTVLAADTLPTAIEAYKSNLGPCHAQISDVRKLFPGKTGQKLTREELFLRKSIGRVDLLMGGPPCQGHSNLNNFTRRIDPKNSLYEKMARAAEVFTPHSIIIENVASVVNDQSGVVDRTARALQRLGYYVYQQVVDLSKFGVPQTRKRHVLLASQIQLPPMPQLLSSYEVPERSIAWAISDLLRVKSHTILDTPSNPTPTAKKRIDYLFDHELYDLPDSKRPVCHKNKNHRYGSVYGRLRWHSPSQTITSGFTCMGQGRFVHPRRRRTLTPHEACRIQFIPDFYKFPQDLTRGQLCEAIGNAVPPKLSYIFVCDLLRRNS